MAKALMPKSRSIVTPTKSPASPAMIFFHVMVHMHRGPSSVCHQDSLAKQTKLVMTRACHVSPGPVQ